MEALLITSLYKGAGSSAFCAGLVRLTDSESSLPFLCKPIRITEKTTPDNIDPDVSFFSHLTNTTHPKSWPFSMGIAEARQGLTSSMEKNVLSGFKSIDNTKKIIEGPPLVNSQGQSVPLSLDLADSLDARIIVLIRYETELNMKKCIASLKTLGDRLFGVVLNAVPLYRNHTADSSLIPMIEAEGIAVLGKIPESRCMLSVTVSQLVQHIKGTFLSGSESRDDLVSHVMIGGLFLGSGIDHFARYDNKAVIVRGDRPDIQMAALATPTKCLILTGGQHPIEYVTYEALEEDVPVAIVNEDTLETTRRLDTLFRNASVHHPNKANCYAGLLSKAIDPLILKSVL
jgi:BioD-like phosphotransacetylase family protein